jgi:hypothetical protein
MAMVTMPRKTPRKEDPEDKNPQSLAITAGTRFWLTLVDATYTGPEEDAPEPRIVWVEVHSVDERRNPQTANKENAVIAKILLDPSAHKVPLLRIKGTDVPNQFLDIKIKAEYAQDTLGKAHGTGPHYTDVSKPNAPEISPRQHPREF